MFTIKSAEDPTKFAIDDDDADEVWEYFIEFVKMAIRHIHRNRGPTIHRENNNISITYDNSDYMTDIDIIKWAKVYEVNLMWV